MRIALVRSLAVFLGFASISVGGNADSAVFFRETFESEIGSGPSPRWSWQPSYSDQTGRGMMVGEGDIYERSRDIVYAGDYSLRLSFDGRNGWCNTCGSVTAIVGVRMDREHFSLVSWEGGASPLVGARQIFNKSDRWSMWQASDVSASTVQVGGKPERNMMGGKGVFQSGDEIKIARACGIDGVVGKSLDRRSDCDSAINYLQGIDEDDFSYGDQIARRFYVYVPAKTVLPNVGLKLGYMKFKRDDGSAPVMWSILAVHRGERLEVATSAISGSHTFTKTTLERDKWYYYEEVFTRETGARVKDGKYALFFEEAGNPDPKPIVELDGLNFGSLRATSIIGNWQHTNDAKGYIYIDEVVVASKRVGPLEGANPPRAPVLMVQ